MYTIGKTPLIPVARQAFLLSRGVEWPGGKPTIFPSEEEERVSHARTAGPFHTHQKGMQINTVWF